MNTPFPSAQEPTHAASIPATANQDYHRIRVIMQALRTEIRNLGAARAHNHSQPLTRALVSAQRQLNTAHSALYDALTLIEHEGGQR